MRLSDLSIERPVLATVMSLLIVVMGSVAFFTLPVRELPDVDRPLVSVTTVYSGASPETVEATITEPLERVLNGIEGIRNIDSQSSFGGSSINIEFEAGRDIDLAATEVSNAVLRAVDRLPDDAKRPEVRKSAANARPIMFINVIGPEYSPVDLTDFADRYVRTPLQLLPGVAQAIISGERRYAMRVWLDPARMAARGVDALDVRRAIQESNLQLPAGELESEGRKFTINADARIADPEVFGRIVIREDDDLPIRIEDVGHVELGSENYQSITRHTGRDVVGVGIIRQSRSNELAISQAVREKLDDINATLPEGVYVDVAVDFTKFVREALKEVTITLAIAFAIVVIVNLVFLRSPTTTAITTAVIPVALVGTLAGLLVLDFSINVLTLLALVLSVGLLVDDSIVVQENIYRRQERGESPREAALRGAREVGFPVIATTAAVLAVLLPLSLMTGNTGRLFREFAITMAVAVTISTFVALTLVPMLCSRFLHVASGENELAKKFEHGLESTRSRYLGWLDAALAHPKRIAVALVVVVVGVAFVFGDIRQTFLPVEDRGRMFVQIRAPEGSTAAYTRRALSQLEEVLLSTDEISTFFAAIGMGFGARANTANGMVFTTMTHWDERAEKQQAVVERVRNQLFGIPEALVYAFSPASISQRSYSDVEVVVKSSNASLDEFAALRDQVVAAMHEVPGLVNADSDLRLENPQLDILFDRERAADIGVPVSAVSESLRLLVSQNPADDFILRNKSYDVVTALASPFRSVPEHLGEVHVRTQDGAMVALSGLIDTVPRSAPTWLNHYDLQRSVTFTGNLADGAALGDVLPAVQAIVRENLPRGFSVDLRNASREFVESGAQIYLTFVIALLVIYLVLAAQFESFIDPLSVMLTVPLATFGALFCLWFPGEVNEKLAWIGVGPLLPQFTLNLYSQIGIILLVGLVTKNAILLVDFANQARARGLELGDALREAGKTRFRPILMTSVTSILGAMPLVLASSAGAESRQAIGVAVVGGLVFSTALTLLVVPVVHGAIVRAATRFGWGAPPPLVELGDSAEA